MLICPSCNHQQEAGKFCGVCGTAMVSQTSAEDSPQTSANSEKTSQVTNVQPEEVNESVQRDTQEHSSLGTQGAATVETEVQPTADAIKERLGNYWSYSLNLLKNPVRAFRSDESHFINSLITIGLYAILFSLSIYFLGHSLLKAFGPSWVEDSLPFFSIVSRLTFFILIMLVITLGSAFTMVKLAKNQESIKAIVTQYGSILVPFTALNVLAMIGGIIGSVQLTLFSLAISVVFTLSYVPALFVYEKVSKIQPNGQKVYFSLGTILLISFISFLLGDAVLMEFIGNIEDILYYGW